MGKTRYFLGIFPTPGGDKHHLFTLNYSNDTISGTITNSMGPVELENCIAVTDGFSADMPAGPGKHHFEAVYTQSGIHVYGSVIMEGNAVGNYEADMNETGSNDLPTDE